MNVSDKLCKGILNRDMYYFNNNIDYLFCCENDNSYCDIIIPLYIDYSCSKTKSRIISMYPRFLINFLRE